jgi:HEAT repeat protein
MAGLMVAPGAALAQRPTAEAIRGRITTHLLANRTDLALSAYDEYVAAAGKPDAQLLRRIAVSELGQVIKRHANDPGMTTAAVERQALSGDAVALASLKAAASSAEPAKQTEAIAALVSLINIGEKGLGTEISRLLTSAPADPKQQIIQALQHADARPEAGRVAALLNDSDPQVRAAAARAIGQLEYRPAIPQLKAIFESDTGILRLIAGSALKRLGERMSIDVVSKALASETPEIRLLAAEGYSASEQSLWLAAVKQLRTDPNPQVRIRATELLACCDVSTARSDLLEALASPIAPLRVEAAGVLERKQLADVRVARRLLADPLDQVRLHGAGIAIRLAAASVAPK